MEIFGKNFRPPFCPNRKCTCHKGYKDPSVWTKWSSFKPDKTPYRIQRFHCKACNVTYSRHTFLPTYWQKRPDLIYQLFFKVTGCMSNRQIARDLRVSPSTIDRQISRLARHCLLFHLHMIKGLLQTAEYVVDGFESFEYSQYFPIHHHLAVEKDSHFFMYFTDSPLRRNGRMTPFQKERRQELENRLGRPDPKAIEKDMRELLDFTLGDASHAIVHSDDHHAYRRSIRALDCEISHIVTPGSRKRDKKNRLWSINLLDLLVRHSTSGHKRETISFPKCRQGSSDRLAVFLVWRNYIKGTSEKSRGSPSPAMLKGLTDFRLEPEDIIVERLFPDHIEMPPRWHKYYWRLVPTPVLPVNLKHELKYAF